MKDVSATSLTVWLIEDHRAYGERLMRALNRLEGIRCTARFTACEDALVALRSTVAPHVVLLDIGLPGISGIEGIALLREQAPHCAAVILTVFEDDEKIFRAICAGAVGYLLKTATSDEIAAALHAVANGGSPMTPRVARRVLERFSRANPPQRNYGLTPRERDILELLVKGLTIKETAAQLGIGFYTADEYIRSVYVKLQVQSRGGAIAKAINEGLVPPSVR
jgi:DNA-binding NarL/FixJ family response regulator